MTFETVVVVFLILISYLLGGVLLCVIGIYKRLKPVNDAAGNNKTNIEQNKGNNNDR